MLGSSIDDHRVRHGERGRRTTPASTGATSTCCGCRSCEGRAIARTDVDDAPRVAVVNETLARILAPDGDAIGRTFRFRDADTTVVGIARDAKYASLDEATPPFFYVPLAQLRDQRAHPRWCAGRRRWDRPSSRPSAARDPRLPAPRVSTLADDTRIVLSRSGPPRSSPADSA